MEKYLASLVFFVKSSDTELKDELLDELRNLKQVTILDIYDDREDWNVECEVIISERKPANIDKSLENLLPNVPWDYHYIKGIDNNYLWQP